MTCRLRYCFHCRNQEIYVICQTTGLYLVNLYFGFVRRLCFDFVLLLCFLIVLSLQMHPLYFYLVFLRALFLTFCLYLVILLQLLFKQILNYMVLYLIPCQCLLQNSSFVMQVYLTSFWQTDACFLNLE